MKNIIGRNYEVIASSSQGQEFMGISKKGLKIAIPLEMRGKGYT